MPGVPELCLLFGCGMPLTESRKKLQDLDAKLVKLLIERAKIVQEIAGTKQEFKLSVYQPGRWNEMQVIRHDHTSNEPVEVRAFVDSVFQCIHEASIQLQENQYE